ncbi:MAG: sigma-70 family RNA polymerase sigma factor [Chloroflexi bacterium]|nr:sigma-70 family RNA polymerase sigma factor [Chloroflexota bacterium]
MLNDDDTRKDPLITQNPPPPEQVIERYRPLVLTLIKGLSRQSHLAGLEAEDLFQEANAALIELTRDYAPQRGVPLGNYLKQKLKWRLVNFLNRELRRKQRTLEIDESILEHLVQRTEALPSPDVLNPRLRAAFRRLSPKQRSVLYEIYWRDRSAQELAQQLGVSPQNVTALRRRAEAAIREEMTHPEDKTT